MALLSKDKFKELLAEWGARRAGRKGMESTGLHKTVRDVTGPVGNAHSRSWDMASEHTKKYNQSFDPRVPPSLFVSERDRKRANQPMPVSERCIEDWPKK